MNIFNWLDNKSKRKYIYKQIKHYRDELDGYTIVFGSYSKSDKIEMINSLSSVKNEILAKIVELEKQLSEI